jgi:hypothetical protein
MQQHFATHRAYRHVWYVGIRLFRCRVARDERRDSHRNPGRPPLRQICGARPCVRPCMLIRTVQAAEPGPYRPARSWVN